MSFFAGVNGHDPTDVNDFHIFHAFLFYPNLFSKKKKKGNCYSLLF